MRGALVEAAGLLHCGVTRRLRWPLWLALAATAAAALLRNQTLLLAGVTFITFYVAAQGLRLLLHGARSEHRASRQAVLLGALLLLAAVAVEIVVLLEARRALA
jgi:hypothetical protein